MSKGKQYFDQAQEYGNLAHGWTDEWQNKHPNNFWTEGDKRDGSDPLKLEFFKQAVKYYARAIEAATKDEKEDPASWYQTALKHHTEDEKRVTELTKRHFDQGAKYQEAAALHKAAYYSFVGECISNKTRWSKIKDYDSDKESYENLSKFQKKLQLVEQINESLRLFEKAANCYKEALDKASNDDVKCEWHHNAYNNYIDCQQNVASLSSELAKQYNEIGVHLAGRAGGWREPKAEEEDKEKKLKLFTEAVKFYAKVIVTATPKDFDTNWYNNASEYAIKDKNDQVDRLSRELAEKYYKKAQQYKNDDNAPNTNFILNQIPNYNQQELTERLTLFSKVMKCYNDAKNIATENNKNEEWYKALVRDSENDKKILEALSNQIQKQEQKDIENIKEVFFENMVSKEFGKARKNVKVLLAIDPESDTFKKYATDLTTFQGKYTKIRNLINQIKNLDLEQHREFQKLVNDIKKLDDECEAIPTLRKQIYESSTLHESYIRRAGMDYYKQCIESDLYEELQSKCKNKAADFPYHDSNYAANDDHDATSTISFNAEEFEISSVASADIRLPIAIDSTNQIKAANRLQYCMDNAGGGNCGVYAVRDMLQTIDHRDGTLGSQTLRSKICQAVKSFFPLFRLALDEQNLPKFDEQNISWQDVTNFYIDTFGPENFHLFKQLIVKLKSEDKSGIQRDLSNLSEINSWSQLQADEMVMQRICKHDIFGINITAILSDHDVIATGNYKTDGDSYYNKASQNGKWLTLDEVKAYLFTLGFICSEYEVGDDGTFFKFVNLENQEIGLHNDSRDSANINTSSGTHWRALTAYGISEIFTPGVSYINQENPGNIAEYNMGGYEPYPTSSDILGHAQDYSA